MSILIPFYNECTRKDTDDYLKYGIQTFGEPKKPHVTYKYKRKTGKKKNLEIQNVKLYILKKYITGISGTKSI